jgi:hypothetical protein
MNVSESVNESVSVSGSAGAGNDHANVSVEGYIGVDMGAEAHLQADKSGLDAGAEYHEVAQASATASGGVQQEGIGGVGGSATVYVKTGTELEGHVVAGDHGVDVGAGASIGNAAGVDAEITCSNRYTSTTAGAGVSIGEHFEAGGSAQATCDHGVVTVGVAGDLAAVVGLDVDVAVSVDTKQIVSDGKEVVHVVEKVAPVVTQTTNTAVHAVENTAKSVTNTVSNGAKSATNSVKKAFKKIKL